MNDKIELPEYFTFEKPELKEFEYNKAAVLQGDSGGNSVLPEEGGEEEEENGRGV